MNLIILDFLYYGQLESKNLLVHMEPSIIKTMVAFVYIAILKDALIGLVTFYLYSYEGKDF